MQLEASIFIVSILIAATGMKIFVICEIYFFLLLISLISSFLGILN